MSAEKPEQVTGQDQRAFDERAKRWASVFAKDRQDYVEFLRTLVPEPPADSAPFFSRAPLLISAGCLLEFIKLRGLATPEEIPAICSDRDRLRQTLENDPEVWGSISSVFLPGNERSLDGLMAALAEVQAHGSASGANPPPA
jgi:hypothetical protein